MNTVQHGKLRKDNIIFQFIQFAPIATTLNFLLMLYFFLEIPNFPHEK